MKKIPEYIYKTPMGQGVTFSTKNGNHWANIMVYNINPLNCDSKKVKTKNIKERIYVNQFGWLN